MYEYINGKVVSIKDKHLVLESNGIGYLVQIGNNKLFNLNDDIKLYVYQYVKEEIMDLYGFKTLEEKELFLLLLSVKGIGPKSAITASSNTTTKVLYQAISKSDTKYLSSFPGIGPKAAQQIIIDLKGKIKCDIFTYDNDNFTLALDALTSLGYSKNVVIKTFNDINMDNELDVIIKDSLQLLSRV